MTPRASRSTLALRLPQISASDGEVEDPVCVIKKVKTFGVGDGGQEEEGGRHEEDEKATTMVVAE